MAKKYVIFIGFGPKAEWEIGESPTPTEGTVSHPKDARQFNSMGEAVDWYIQYYDGMFLESPIIDWIQPIEEAIKLVGLTYEQSKLVKINK